MRTRWILWFAMLATAAVIAPAARADEISEELAELRERMETRYPALRRLRGDGKIGETWQGRVEAVKTEHLEEETTVGGKKTKVKNLLAAENQDRERVYELIAKRTGGTKEAVAKTNAQRNFDKAAPDDWLKTEDGWKQKKDLDREDDGEKGDEK